MVFIKEPLFWFGGILQKSLVAKPPGLKKRSETWREKGAKATSKKNSFVSLWDEGSFFPWTDKANACSWNIEAENASARRSAWLSRFSLCILHGNRWERQQIRQSQVGKLLPLQISTDTWQLQKYHHRVIIDTGFTAAARYGAARRTGPGFVSDWFPSAFSIAEKQTLKGYSWRKAVVIRGAVPGI